MSAAVFCQSRQDNRSTGKINHLFQETQRNAASNNHQWEQHQTDKCLPGPVSTTQMPDKTIFHCPSPASGSTLPGGAVCVSALPCPTPPGRPSEISAAPAPVSCCCLTGQGEDQQSLWWCPWLPDLSCWPTVAIGHVTRQGVSLSSIQLVVYQNKCCSQTGGSGNARNCNLYDYGCNKTLESLSQMVYFTCVCSWCTGKLWVKMRAWFYNQYLWVVDFIIKTVLNIL